MDGIRKGTEEKSVPTTLDYNMKLEPIWFRETSTEFYGKRGISWHIIVLLYRVAESGDTDSLGGADAGDTVLPTLFIDHILHHCKMQGL